MTLRFQNIDPVTAEADVGGQIYISGGSTGVGVGALASGRLALRGASYGEESAAIPEPVEPATATGRLAIGGAADGFEVLVSDAENGGKLGITGAATGEGASYASGKLGLRGGATEMAPIQNYAFYLKASPLMYAYANTGYGLMREDFTVGQQALRLYAAMVRSIAGLADSHPGRYSGATRVVDIVATEDGMNWLRTVFLQEGLLAGDTVVPDSRAFGRVITRVLLEGKASNYAEALAVMSEALTLLSFQRSLTLALVADDVELESQITQRYLQVVRLLEMLATETWAAPQYRMVALVSEALYTEQLAAGTVDMVAIFREAVGLSMTLSFEDGQYIAWVINTESTGLSRYTNYPFNSFMTINRRYFGVHSGGIVELVGDTDAGIPISAKLRTGMYDFNDRHEKAFSDAFIGMAADGTMLLKVILVNHASGEKDMAVYKVNYRPADSSRETRAQLGRGLKAVEWDFVLENVDGAHFNLDIIQFAPLVGSRRTRG